MTVSQSERLARRCIRIATKLGAGEETAIIIIMELARSEYAHPNKPLSL
jgi:hypothetical protein